jgi:hypothetical protein
MITVKNLATLNKLPSTPKDGDMALLTDTKEIFCYSNGEWNAVKTDSGINTSLYDLNATAISQLPAHNNNLMQMAEDIRMIDEFIEEFDGKYFTLLCKELGNGAFYSTILHRNWTASESAGQAVISCLAELGTIHAISNEESHLEFWVKEPDENMICLLFFSSDSMVIEVK